MRRIGPVIRQPWFLFGLSSALLVAAGLLAEGRVGAGRLETVRTMFVQVGLFGLALAVLALPLLALAERRRAAVLARLRAWLLAGALTVVLAFAAGEAFLRLHYPEGQSFSSHFGPMVRRYERDFTFNRFDSRGPEAAGPKSAQAVRVLVQGDSITWGQGVRDEAALYTSRLLQRLRAERPGVEMAVVAKGGREIDGHLAELRAWGREIRPDVVVYQWFVNDLELDKGLRRTAEPWWHALFLHRPLARRSYLYFFLDYHLTRWWTSSSTAYEDYIRRRFAPGTPGWQRFEEVFRAWAAEAKALTPRVLVVLYPFIGPAGPEFQGFIPRMQALCRAEGLATIDLTPWFEVFDDDYTRMFATPFDSHPGAAVHARMAEALHGRLHELWPDLFRAPRAPPLPS